MDRPAGTAPGTTGPSSQAGSRAAELSLRVEAHGVVVAAEDRVAHGLDCWVDGTMGIHRRDGVELVVAPNGPNVATHDLRRGLLAGLTSRRLAIAGLPPDVRHASGGPLYHDPGSGLLLLAYHGETCRGGDPMDFYSFIGLAVSDDDGASFRDLGRIVGSDLRDDDPTRPSPVELGPGAWVVHDGWCWVYFVDRNAATVRLDLGVARAPLADVLAAARAGTRPEFRKFHAGGWSSPALGGPATDLLAGTPHHVCWFDVTYLAAVERFLVVYSTARWDRRTGAARWWVAAASSPDGVRWSRPWLLDVDPCPGEALYVSIDSLGPADRRVDGDRFDLYRVVSHARRRWDDAALERFTVTLAPSPTDAAPDSPRRTAVAGASSRPGGGPAGVPEPGVRRAGVAGYLRRAVPADRDELLDLWRRCGGEHVAAAGTEGPSPAPAPAPAADPGDGPRCWVAVDRGGAITGVRTYWPWDLRAADGRVVRAVRAGATLVDPDHRRATVFAGAASDPVEELRADGVELVVDVGGDRLRPDGAEPGWFALGRAPVAARPRSRRGATLAAVGDAGAPSRSLPATVGVAVADALADAGALDRLLAAVPSGRGLAPVRDAALLRRRYAPPQLGYRAVTVGDDAGGGLVVLRLQRRAGRVECALAEVLVPGPADRREVVRWIARATGADLLLRAGGVGDGFVPVRRWGPPLAVRPLASSPVPRAVDLHLSLGDLGWVGGSGAPVAGWPDGPFDHLVAWGGQ